METTEEQQDAPAEAESVELNGEMTYEQLVEMYDESMRHLTKAKSSPEGVIAITSNDVIVDVGYKSEGLVPIREFTSREGELQVGVGDSVEVLLEQTEGAEGNVMLSKIKAERMRVWSEVENSFKEGKIIKGRVIDRIKGGLTIDVGLRAFLPGSLVDIKPVKNLESLKGAELEFKVISLDRRRNNIVLSRKAVLEKEYEKKKKETLGLLEEGVELDGVVKNITDYGVFIDLGGIDGLLHITDISWGRVNHPSEHFTVGDETRIIVLKFDRETERVSLGYKQRFDDPWTLVDKKFPLGSRVNGKVVSLVDYGAFVEIEEGVEGLIHVSEMSWTKKVVTPSKILNVGDMVEAIVSELDMKATPDQPVLATDRIESLGRACTALPGRHDRRRQGPEPYRVRRFRRDHRRHRRSDSCFRHELDQEGEHPSEVLDKGDDVRARITNIDTSNQRVSLSIKEFLPNEWQDFMDGHNVGDPVEGRVVNVTDFGLFIDIYDGLEGLAHVSEIDIPAGKLEDHYASGRIVRARILRIEDDEKKVGLTMRGVERLTADEIAEFEAEYAAKVAASAPAEEDGDSESEEEAVEASSDADSPEETVEASSDEETTEATEVADSAEEPADSAEEADDSAEETETAESDSEEAAPAAEADAEDPADEENSERPLHLITGVTAFFPFLRIFEAQCRRTASLSNCSRLIGLSGSRWSWSYVGRSV